MTYIFLHKTGYVSLLNSDRKTEHSLIQQEQLRINFCTQLLNEVLQLLTPTVKGQGSVKDNLSTNALREWDGL